MKHDLGQPHRVAKSTWHRHLQEASTEEEREKMRSGRELQGHTMELEPGAGEAAAGCASSSDSTDRTSLPPSAHRAAALRDLIKRARENENLRRNPQHDKRI